MRVKFKPTCDLPIAKAVGDEVGEKMYGNEDAWCVCFPVYGAEFSLPAECFEVVPDAPVEG